MDREDIKAHWTDWAKTYGTSLRATTKTSTAKMLELDALTRAFRVALGSNPPKGNVLEVGCGNGENLLHLATVFPTLQFTGIDFIPEMIEAATQRRAENGIPADRLKFSTGDILAPDFEAGGPYDLIFTDRCLINLSSDELICEALSRLCSILAPSGQLLMIENNIQTFSQQNWARQAVGLPARTPAAFNHFLDEAVVLPHLEDACAMEIVAVEDFISLHDLVLYVLLPAISDGKIDYEHPLVELAARLNVAISNEKTNALGSFGQNRLYHCRKLN